MSCKRFIVRFCFLVFSALGPIAALPAWAVVEHVEVMDRSVVADGKSFGNVGAYARISGRLHYSVDPESDYNTSIVDLSLAPRDARGRVNFTSDFVLLAPLDASRGNGRLLYDVTNRGNVMMLGRFNNGSGRDGGRTASDMGNGFLLEQGYALLWTGWNWDVVPRSQNVTIQLPIAQQPNGRAIRGRVFSEIALSERSETTAHIGRNSIGYPPISLSDSNAVLSVRDPDQSTYESVPRNAWQFGRTLMSSSTAQWVPNPKWVTMETGFEPGRVYRLVYDSQNPRVVGLGLAAIRDALSFFSFEQRDSLGTPNPLLETGTSLPTATLAYGASQSGRVLNTLILHGLHVDESGRMVFDGAMIDIAGGGKGGFNFRFAQTTRHFSHDIDLDYATDYFPFSTGLQTNPRTGELGSLLDEARRLGAVPKLFIVNSSTDYWGRSASLIHTETDGSSDVADDENVRIYMIAGGQHATGITEQRGTLVHCRNPLDQRPILRALITHLDAWLTLDRDPPPSAYPRVSDGTLVNLETYRSQFPNAPFLRTPENYLKPPYLDFGPRFESEGIPDIVPPNRGPVFETLVPAPNEDGLDTAGLRLPDIAVPLGTYTGWNPQNAATGAPNRLSRWSGSFIPFARTVPERTDRGDPRLAITERYISRADYLESYAAATLDLAGRELILGMDINPMIEQAGERFDQVMSHNPYDESCGYLMTP